MNNETDIDKYSNFETKSMFNILRKKKLEILIVDDDVLNTFSLKLLIKAIAKVKCTIVCNGQEAIDEVVSKQQSGEE